MLKANVKFLLPNSDINDACTITADCSGTNVECRDDGRGPQCLCETGHTPTDATNCEPVGKLRGPLIRSRDAQDIYYCFDITNRHFSLLNVKFAGACGYDFVCDGRRLVRAYLRRRRGAI